MNLNFVSQSFLAKEFLPALKRKALADLIFIGSEAALAGSRKGSIYCASKFALRGFSQSLRDECAKSSVRVSLINPGMVKTDFFQSLTFEPGEENSSRLPN
jgi:short-subunit dehydrogenase